MSWVADAEGNIGVRMKEREKVIWVFVVRPFEQAVVEPRVCMRRKTNISPLLL